MTSEEKVYSIGLKGSSHSYALVQLHADQFHGVHCLKGIARSHKHPEIAGRRVYVPVAEITSITEYDSWADFEKASKLASDDSLPPPATKKKAKKRSKMKKRR